MLIGKYEKKTALGSTHRSTESIKTHLGEIQCEKADRP
jgi:hypothetical protein